MPDDQTKTPSRALPTSAAARRFHPYTLKFDDPTVESAYIQNNNARVVTQVRIVAILIAIVVIAQSLVAYFNLPPGDSPARDAWLSILPLSLFDVGLLIVGVWLSWRPWAVQWGQPLVLGFTMIFYALLLLAAQFAQSEIMMIALFFNYGLGIVLVAFGLVFRLLVPLAIIFPIGFTIVAQPAMGGQFTPSLITFATAATMLWVAYALERAQRSAWADAAALADEQALTERLLLNVLPPSIARRMQAGETLIADSHDEATVVFVDIADFTPLSASMSASALVEILDEIFAAFDEIATAHDLEKIKTIGDAYMLAAGLPSERANDPANALDAALEMRDRISDIADARNLPISMRAGVHTGPVVAGVIGRSKFVYDLWGDSVNVASRMESTAPIGSIQTTGEVRDAMASQFAFTPRGEIDVKGKGQMQVWLLDGRLASD